MSEEGLTARVLAGARSLIRSSRRRARPARTVADLLRERAEAAQRAADGAATGETVTTAVEPDRAGAAPAAGAGPHRAESAPAAGPTDHEGARATAGLPDPDDVPTPPTGAPLPAAPDAEPPVREPAMTGLFPVVRNAPGLVAVRRTAAIPTLPDHVAPRHTGPDGHAAGGSAATEVARREPELAAPDGTPRGGEAVPDADRAAAPGAVPSATTPAGPGSRPEPAGAAPCESAEGGPHAEPAPDAPPPAPPTAPSGVAATGASGGAPAPGPSTAPDADGVGDPPPATEPTGDTEPPRAEHTDPDGDQLTVVPGPGPRVEGVVRPPSRADSLTPPWVRAALMGREPGDSTAEQAAAGRALRRTFGLPRDPGPVALVGAALAVCPPDHRALPRPVTVVVRPLAAGAPVPVRFRVAARGGAPLEGAQVMLLDGQGATVTSAVTDAVGRGRMVAPHPDSYVLVASASGHQPGATAVGPDAGPAEVELLLARSASVAGVLRVDGETVPDAQLTLVQDGEVVDTVVTDAAGRFRVEDLTGGVYVLAVSADECPPAVLELEVPGATDLVYDIDLAGS